MNDDKSSGRSVACVSGATVCDSDVDMGVSVNRGPQNGPQYIMILIVIETPKKIP